MTSLGAIARFSDTNAAGIAVVVGASGAMGFGLRGLLMIGWWFRLGAGLPVLGKLLKSNSPPSIPSPALSRSLGFGFFDAAGCFLDKTLAFSCDSIRKKN